MQLKSFIEITEHARGYLNHVIESLPREKWGEAGPSGGWSLKDVLAHIAWHDDAMIEVCEKRDLVGSVWWTLPMQERNDNIYSQYKDASTEVVQEFFEASYEKMLAAVKTLSDEDLNDSSRFHDMPEDWTPWHMLASNGYEHYIRHIGQVVAIKKAVAS